MCAAAGQGDFAAAAEIHYKLMPLFKGLFVETNPLPVKAALARMGLIENHLRLPLTPLTEAGLKKTDAHSRGTGAVARDSSGIMRRSGACAPGAALNIRRTSMLSRRMPALFAAALFGLLPFSACSEDAPVSNRPFVASYLFSGLPRGSSQRGALWQGMDGVGISKGGEATFRGASPAERAALGA